MTALHSAKLDAENHVTLDESELRKLGTTDLVASAHRWERFDRQLLTSRNVKLTDDKMFTQPRIRALERALWEGESEGAISFDDEQLAEIDPEGELRALRPYHYVQSGDGLETGEFWRPARLDHFVEVVTECFYGPRMRAVNDDEEPLPLEWRLLGVAPPSKGKDHSHNKGLVELLQKKAVRSAAEMQEAALKPSKLRKRTEITLSERELDELHVTSISHSSWVCVELSSYYVAIERQQPGDGLGLRWEALGTQAPTQGIELGCMPLSRAISFHQLAFDEAQWNRVVHGASYKTRTEELDKMEIEMLEDQVMTEVEIKAHLEARDRRNVRQLRPNHFLRLGEAYYEPKFSSAQRWECLGSGRAARPEGGVKLRHNRRLHDALAKLQLTFTDEELRKLNVEEMKHNSYVEV